MKKSKFSTSTCPACGDEGFCEHITKSFAEHNGIRREINHYQHLCSSCGGYFATSEDSKNNKRELIKFQKDIDGIPSGEDIRRMRTSSGLTIKQAGLLFGGGEIAFHKYESDDLVPSEAMVNLIKLSINHPETIHNLQKIKRHHFSYKSTVTLDASDTERCKTMLVSDWLSTPIIPSQIKKSFQLHLTDGDQDFTSPSIDFYTGKFDKKSSFTSTKYAH